MDLHDTANRRPSQNGATHPLGTLLRLVAAAFLGHTGRGLEEVLAAAGIDGHNLRPDGDENRSKVDGLRASHDGERETSRQLRTYEARRRQPRPRLVRRLQARFPCQTTRTCAPSSFRT